VIVERDNTRQRARGYVASPLGFTVPGRHWYERILLPALAGVIEVVDPWALTAPEEFGRAEARGRLDEFVEEVGRRNAGAIDRCDLLVACLDGQEVDSGTAAEVGYAAARGLRCLGLRTDIRRAGEPGALVNLQVQAFITMSGGRIVASLDDLLDLLAEARS
jgi:nucleoside 2-deoxyribosyltransferase